MPSDQEPTHQLFCYGTLLVPRILVRVLGRAGEDLQFQDAVLPGWTRHPIKGEDYPAVVDEKQLIQLVGDDLSKISDDDRSTRGTLITGLTRKDMELLDIFEDDEYDRKEIPVNVLSEPRTLADLPPSLASPSLRDRSGPLPKTLGQAKPWIYVWAAPLEKLNPHVWSFDEFLRDKAEAWASMNEAEFAAVVAAQSEADADGLVGAKMKGLPDFGRGMRKYWAFDPKYVNLNHGSYGSPPKPIIEARAKLSEEVERCPDVFMRRRMERRLDVVREAVAKIMKADRDEVVIVPNATHGINTIVSNLEWKDGDVVVVYASTYNAVSQTMKYIADRNPGINLEVVNLAFPEDSHDTIVTKTEEMLAKYNKRLTSPAANATPVPEGLKDDSRVRMVIVDSIASVPGVIYPWERVAKVCRDYGVLSLVDGAHSIGQHHIDMHGANPDFFVTNCHKWLMAHRGGAAMYVPVHNQHLIRSSFPTGHYYESKRYPTPGGGHDWNFVRNFDWNGTADFTPWMTILDVIKFREEIGGEDRIIAYNHSLAVAGGKRLAKRWGTQVMDNANGEYTACMVNVRLPFPPAPSAAAEIGRITEYCTEIMLEEKHCMSPVYPHNGHWWTRMSAQVWVDLSDFDYVADVFDDLAKRIQKGEHLQVPERQAEAAASEVA